ncbi:hypothetical protein MVES1_002326 [Malassezia vespertilionis]|uniref:MATE efflux family protein n=1 Tax=Malassezia vespertilionis TaxID=2020962 RepID=A0A2N1JB90_9BASI|nr:uncharacterized protein MVES1_002326 [Malassezia vespertilionis]PKI83821.1 hypothetical protein MVES_002192 [Malassezia vespertilionis]WFD06971.1 hypothetical protein MVES1_002326 [Malassezia vespertilionis]
MYTPSGYGALPRHSVEGGLYPTQTPHHEAAHGDDKEIIYRELALLSRYTASIWATHLLELSLSMVSVFSLGHLGTLELAAASLAGMTANVTGFSMISGLVCALDTLLPATYVRQPRYMGLWTQRVGVVVFCVIPLIILLWLNAERGLLLLGQDPEIAHLARQFLAVLAIGLPGHAVFELCRRFLQAQGMMHAPTVVLLVVSPINAVANYLLVWGPHKMRFGFLGAPMASAISMWLMAVLCMLQCALVAHKNGTWGGWSYKAFDPAGLRVCVALGFAGVLSLASEWWAWEIVGLVTAALGTTSLAAQSVLLITSSVTYQLPYGASVAAAVRVGNLLGGGHMSDARLASLASLLLSVIIGMLNSSVVYVSRDKWGYLFSNDVEVIRLVASVLPILAIFQCADCICGVAGGILRGSGRQSLSAAINLTSYYVIGMPMCLFLAFGPLHMGLRGLWWGLTVALVYGAGIALFYVWYTDWTDVMHRLHRSMSVDDEHV